MIRQRSRRDQGFALVYMAVFITVLLLFTGLAVDSGRAYVVKAQLTKAVDGAALAAARNLNSGNPRGEAERIFRANFPVGYMGTSSVTDPTADPGFFDLQTIVATGVNVVTVRANAVIPTTFMRLANITEVAVSSEGEAQRRMVDLSLAIDVSGSIGAKWPAVRDAVREFIGGFDDNADRIALVTYSNGAKVVSTMPASRGFNEIALKAAVPDTLPGGVTSMAEGLYRAWDQLRTVSSGQQSGLRVIVLFTDGSGNTVPAIFDGTGIAKGLFTSDFPRRTPDPGNITTNRPTIQGLYDTESGNRGPSWSQPTSWWTDTVTIGTIPYLPATSSHQHFSSFGIPGSFPLQTNALTVNGSPQSTRRGLRNFNTGVNKYPADTWNIRNAATNLTEIIADAARSDASGDYPIRIYTIGMGDLVTLTLGTIPETSESVLMRLANDKRSAPDFNSTQMEGKYYFARTEADVGPAFQALQGQLIRLSK
ncbi:MAG TPA: VWA domain-containing protein [Vicinamibacterales bacterium]|nr:VWA domain-containing protein [Vicinamibacterales bacterium]